VERILRLRTEHAVLLAGDAAEAFEHLRKGLPDLILMDLFLPRVDGFHLYRVLKERAATAGIPIILSTSVDLDPVTEARVKQLRVAGRVEMPVSSAELVEVISLVLLRQKDAPPFQRERMAEAPQNVARVVWPREERPVPPPAPKQPPPETPKEVKPVVWPTAGSRGDRGGRKETAGESVQPIPAPKPSGRELRARLAMQATGQQQPDQDREPEGGKKVTGHRRPATRDLRPRTPESTDPTYAEKVRALLQRVDKPAGAKAGREGFQAIPLAQADPGRVVDFTRKKKEDEKPPPETQQSRASDRKGKEKRPPEPSGDGAERPVIRPVQWSQIKKKQ
jgi:CheY-like chemotaxis protein